MNVVEIGQTIINLCLIPLFGLLWNQRIQLAVMQADMARLRIDLETLIHKMETKQHERHQNHWNL